jgi:hypothetical protein
MQMASRPLEQDAGLLSAELPIRHLVSDASGSGTPSLLTYAVPQGSETGWTMGKITNSWIKRVCPLAGSNLGELIWLMLGVWHRFDRENLCQGIAKRSGVGNRN